MNNCYVKKLQDVINNDNLDYFGGAIFCSSGGSAQLVIILTALPYTTVVCKIVEGVQQPKADLTVSGTTQKAIFINPGDKLYCPYNNTAYIKVDGDATANTVSYLYDLSKLIPFISLNSLGRPVNNNIVITYEGDSYDFALGQIKLGRTTCSGIIGGRIWQNFKFGGETVSTYNDTILKWDAQKVYFENNGTTLYEKDIVL